ncbi:MAG: PilZ domain-containing protein [Thermodesulfobacteriota bacterium]
MERRMTGRHNIPLRAIVSFTDATTREFKTLNISDDGAFLISDHAKPKGTRVFMSLFVENRPGKLINNRTMVNLEGTVRRSTSNGMAVYFDHRHRFAGM